MNSVVSLTIDEGQSGHYEYRWFHPSISTLQDFYLININARFALLVELDAVKFFKFSMHS